MKSENSLFSPGQASVANPMQAVTGGSLNRPPPFPPPSSSFLHFPPLPGSPLSSTTTVPTPVSIKQTSPPSETAQVVTLPGPSMVSGYESFLNTDVEMTQFEENSSLTTRSEILKSGSGKSTVTSSSPAGVELSSQVEDTSLTIRSEISKPGSEKDASTSTTSPQKFTILHLKVLPLCYQTRP